MTISISNLAVNNNAPDTSEGAQTLGTQASDDVDWYIHPAEWKPNKVGVSNYKLRVLTGYQYHMFPISDINVITARQLTSAEGGLHTAALTTEQGAQALSVEFAI
jgi:hypothetical protein